MTEKHKKLWAELTALHDKYLKPYKVKLPRIGTDRCIWLVVLYEAYKINPDSFVSKDKIADVVRQYRPEASGDQQIRHLKRDGWYLRSEKIANIIHHAIDPTKLAPEYIDSIRKEQDLLGAGDFEAIKQAWDNRCATCGGVEGDKSWRHYDKPIKLQEGHKDPAKGLAPKNVIPQCQYCNQAYKNDFVFDDKGRVRAVADISPIKRASASVKQKIKDFLVGS